MLTKGKGGGRGGVEMSGRRKKVVTKGERGVWQAIKKKISGRQGRTSGDGSKIEALVVTQTDRYYVVGNGAILQAYWGGGDPAPWLENRWGVPGVRGREGGTGARVVGGEG